MTSLIMTRWSMYLKYLYLFSSKNECFRKKYNRDSENSVIKYTIIVMNTTKLI